MTNGSAHLIDTVNVRRWFLVEKGWLGHKPIVAKAVDGVSLHVDVGEALGIVGESGCGKTTLSRLMLRLDKPTAGQVLFEQSDLQTLSGVPLKRFRKSVQAVFQDPTSSLNPRMRVLDIVGEPISINERAAKAALRRRVVEVLGEVGIGPAAVDSYPHEFSGGQKQRIAIARALSSNPTLVVLDEPVSALDVSFKAQLLNLLLRLQEARRLSYVFIAHDLAAVRYLCQRVAVMYLGNLAETGSALQVFQQPMHPYTQALVAATLTPQSRAVRQRSAVIEDVPSPISPPSGCKFRTRCPHAFERCIDEEPILRVVGDGRRVACHLYD